MALIYPIVCILVIWAISGHVGPAEQVLGLPISAPEWQRGLLAGALAMAVIALWRCIATMFSEGGPAALLSRKALPWSASFVFAVAVAAVSAIDARGAVIGVLTATGAVAVAVGSVRAGNAAVGGAVAVAVTVGVAVIVASLPDVGSTGTPSVAIALATGAFDAAMMLFAVIWLIGVILLSYLASAKVPSGSVRLRIFRRDGCPHCLPQRCGCLEGQPGMRLGRSCCSSACLPQVQSIRGPARRAEDRLGGLAPG